MNVYRMHPARSLRDLVARKVLDDHEDRFELREVDLAGVAALLVSGQVESRPEWASAIRSLTGVDLDLTGSIASAALFLRVGSAAYGLSFGQGWRYLRESRIDRQFGLDVAVRLLDPDEIRKITRLALSAKSRVDRNLVPGGQGLWAFGLREHAELVRDLGGNVESGIAIDLAYIRRRGRYRNFRLSIECADSVHIPLGIEGGSLIADLRELNRVVDEVAINDQLGPLQWVRRLPPGDHRRDGLDTAAAELLTEPDAGRGEVGIAYPARYHDGPSVQRYRGSIGELVIDTDELTIEDLRAGLRAYPPEDRLHVLRSSKIEGFDDAGASLGGDVAALHWTAAEVVDPDFRMVLLDGDWYELGEHYLRHVERIVANAFANTPAWTLPRWQDAPRNGDGRVVEAAYNQHVADTDGRFLCLDRKLVKTRVHPRGFEACDLLGPGNVLVHVKKVSGATGSSVLSHLFAQGLVSIESLTDRETWNEFGTLVRGQDPDRADRLGARPAGLVYAIHRSDKLLRPQTLFTFARSALVSAWVAATTYNIPLQISVIP